MAKRKYEVQFERREWYTITVDAYNIESAIDEAADMVGSDEPYDSECCCIGVERLPEED